MLLLTDTAMRFNPVYLYYVLEKYILLYYHWFYPQHTNINSKSNSRCLRVTENSVLTNTKYGYYFRTNNVMYYFRTLKEIVK